MISFGVSRGRETATSRVRWWSAQRTLVKTTASLLSTTGITALLGLVFWWLAGAHLGVRHRRLWRSGCVGADAGGCSVSPVWNTSTHCSGSWHVGHPTPPGYLPLRCMRQD